jgi:hypothetical protein
MKLGVHILVAVVRGRVLPAASCALRSQGWVAVAFGEVVLRWLRKQGRWSVDGLTGFGGYFEWHTGVTWPDCADAVAFRGGEVPWVV